MLDPYSVPLATTMLVLDAGAAHDGDGFPGLVSIGGLGDGDEHGAQPARALAEVDELAGGGEEVAGADGIEVLDVRAAVEDALEGRVGAEVAAEWALGPVRIVDRVAEEADGRGDATVALAPGVLLVEEERVGVADGAGEHAAGGLVDLEGNGLGLLADLGAHRVGDDRSLGHGAPPWQG